MIQSLDNLRQSQVRFANFYQSSGGYVPNPVAILAYGIEQNRDGCLRVVTNVSQTHDCEAPPGESALSRPCQSFSDWNS